MVGNSLAIGFLVLIVPGVPQRFQLYRGDARQSMTISNSQAPRHTNASQRSLESFFGIGPKVSQGIMAKFHIHPWAKVGSLKNATVLDLTAELSNMKIENDLRREVRDNIQRLKDMGTYRGRRHAMGLPVRGQRTRTQVSALMGSKCGWMLTALDHNCPKAEQDGTRRPGPSAALVRHIYHVLYWTNDDLAFNDDIEI